MFVIHRKLVVKEGFADQATEKFTKPGVIEEQEGFVDLTVLKEKARRGEQSILVLIRWESEEAWKNWEKSDVHLAGHRAKKGKPKPDYLISQEATRYTVEYVKQPK